MRRCGDRRDSAWSRRAFLRSDCAQSNDLAGWWPTQFFGDPLTSTTLQVSSAEKKPEPITAGVAIEVTVMLSCENHRCEPANDVRFANGLYISYRVVGLWFATG
jgi:hypothetical protein